MNEWKKQIKENVEQRNELTQGILNNALSKYGLLRYENILKELRMLEEIARCYETMKKDGNGYDEAEYKELLKKIEELEIEKKIIDLKTKEIMDGER